MGLSGMRTALRLLGVGWYVALSIGGIGYGGYWIDQRLELSPLFTLVGLGLGVAVALIGMFRMLMVFFTDPSTSGSDASGQSERPQDEEIR